MMMNGDISPSPLVVALFGTGNIGNIHLHNIRRHHRLILKYIVELQQDAAQDIVNKYHLHQTTVLHPADVHTVYVDSQVDAVIICTPTNTHESIIKTALQHGKGVFCEKPIAGNLESIKSCYEEAEKAGRPLLCSFNRRFDPSLRKIYTGVKSGAVGKIHIIKTCARDHPVPSLGYLRNSGGIFHDCAVHDIDLVCWLMGEYPETVYTQSYAHIPEIGAIGDVDTAVIMMKFPSGALASIDLSRNAVYGYDQRCEVFGSAGMLRSENHQETGVILADSSGTSSDPPKGSFRQRYADSYVQAMNHFIDTMLGHTETEVRKEDALMVCRIADACNKSTQSGAPVNIREESEQNGGMH